MKRIILSTALLTTSIVASADCNYITDANQRYYCNAITKGNRGYCDYITSNDLRYLCQAEVTQNSGGCSYIHDSNTRNICYAKTRR